jgi:hypothetical protein
MAETHQFDAGRLFSVKGFVCVVTGGGVSTTITASFDNLLHVIH